MEKLQIHTGQICLEIVDDHGETRGVFKFNPDDTAVAKRVFALQQSMEDKFVEYEEKCKKSSGAEDNLELLDDIIQYVKGVIDEIFGAGSSQLLFGDANTLSMFEDFFVGITPYFKSASEARVKKYSKKNGKTKK